MKLRACYRLLISRIGRKTTGKELLNNQCYSSKAGSISKYISICPHCPHFSIVWRVILVMQYSLSAPGKTKYTLYYRTARNICKIKSYRYIGPVGIVHRACSWEASNSATLNLTMKVSDSEKLIFKLMKINGPSI